MSTPAVMSSPLNTLFSRMHISLSSHSAPCLPSIPSPGYLTEKILHESAAAPMSSSSGTQSPDSSPPLEENDDDRLHVQDQLLYGAFVASRSRVVRFSDIPTPASAFLYDVFFGSGREEQTPLPVPFSILKDTEGGMWAIYSAHEEADAALALSRPALIVLPALESDLQPISKFHRLDLAPLLDNFSSRAQLLAAPQPLRGAPVPPRGLRLSVSSSDLRSTRSASRPTQLFDAGYTMSSNPPNPKSMFRAGDWICSFSNCAEHNFGRNLSCRGCGCPRPGHSSSTVPNAPQLNHYPSPRFTTTSGTSDLSLADLPKFSISSPRPYPHMQNISPMEATFPHAQSQPQSRPPPSHHLLTPSGRAISVGGRIQNISSDPHSPCLMYWPDNEPLPEQGQIRPSGLLGLPHPPILNTGNRGPIEHQPGDWVCRKCNYLNWRRRKVCQTCFPYAEGNGDSISAAVQAVRMNNLSHLLTPAANPIPAPQSMHGMPAQSCMQPPVGHPAQMGPMSRLHSRSIDSCSPHSVAPLHRARSQMDMNAAYADVGPIYQTSAPLYSTAPQRYSPPVTLHAPSPASGPLLPAFLQDMFQPPSLSPASTSSADISADDYTTSPMSIHGTQTQLHERQVPRKGSGSSLNIAKGSIWRMDGEESRVFASPGTPAHGMVVGADRKNMEPAWA